MPRRYRIHFTEACSPTHSPRAVPVGFVGLWTSSPPPHLPRRPLHFHGRILRVPGIVRGVYDVIQGVVGHLMAYNLKPLLRFRRTALRLQDQLQRVRTLHRPRTHFIEARSPTHSSPMAPIGSIWPRTSPPPRRLPCRPLHFHGRLDNVSGIV